VISLEGAKAAAGKTDMDLRNHGWFAFFAPRDNPEIAGVVLAEHGEHGSNAAPIARHVIDTYFAVKAGQPPPVFPAPVQPASAPTPPGTMARQPAARPDGGVR
jgi:penicillin-binding protein 2